MATRNYCPLRTGEVAEFLGCSTEWVRRGLASVLAPRIVGGRRIYDREIVRQFKAARDQARAAKGSK